MITDAYHRYVVRLTRELGKQKLANGRKRRKLRALRAALKRETAENTTLRAVLEEADEILTEMDWHTDRGLLQRIRAALKH